MERFLGIDNTIFYSLGFVYAVAYDFKYNLIFDLNYLKDLKYYNNSIGYKCYKKVSQYWYNNDREYLEKLGNVNKKTRKVIDKFLNVPYKGEKGVLFDFWKIEDVVFDFIMKYPKKDKLIREIKKIEKNMRVKYPNSIPQAKEDYKTDRSIEILGFKNNDLKKNPHFLGFYIRGPASKSLLKRLKKEYPDKILFDGKKIKKIGELK